MFYVIICIDGSGVARHRLLGVPRNADYHQRKVTTLFSSPFVSAILLSPFIYAFSLLLSRVIGDISRADDSSRDISLPILYLLRFIHAMVTALKILRISYRTA